MLLVGERASDPGPEKEIVMSKQSSKQSSKYTEAGVELTPGHSQKSEIEKKLDGIAAGVRTLAKKLDERARANDVHTHQSTVETRRQELAPFLAQARRTIDEMAAVEQELRPAVSAVLSLNPGSLRRILHGMAWNRFVAVHNEAHAISEIFRSTPDTLRRLLRIARELSPAEAGASWKGVKAEFTEVVRQQAKHPAHLRQRVAYLQAALAQVEKDVEKAEAASPATVQREQPAVQESTEDFSPFEKVDISDDGEDRS